ncbi:hypothetical protein Syun_007783 [Stephania yunnanensis]|uniref:Uncharacterized protein n=1 Tax=Stephania yunnanensis TaxID=152371 RepID=A0AAP0KZ18_9MAGN
MELNKLLRFYEKASRIANALMLRVFLRRERCHIPLPCVAASLPLPLGTGHETYIS